jgi:glutamyl-tRNA reductase
MPRDVETAVSTLPGIMLFDVDSLQTHLDESLAARQAELPRVEAIIAQELATWKAETQTAASRPVIYHLRDKAERIRQRELERTLRHLGNLDPHTVTHINHLSRSLVNKLLHEPTTRLRQQASNTAYIATVCHLFDLPEADG